MGTVKRPSSPAGRSGKNTGTESAGRAGTAGSGGPRPGASVGRRPAQPQGTVSGTSAEVWSTKAPQRKTEERRADRTPKNPPMPELKEKKRGGASLVLKLVLLLAMLAVLGFLIFRLVGALDKGKGGDDPKGGSAATSQSSTPADSDGGTAAEPEDEKAAKLAEAERMAVQYDYEGAIAKLNEIPNAQNDADVIVKLSEYQTAQSSLVATDPTKVTHVFFHSLVVEPQKAFFQDNDLTPGFCQWMTTVDEFNRMMQQMYDRGYVLVDLHDLFDETVDENGVTHITTKQVMLPSGKIPFVLSLDDLSYYHSYDGRGIASKMVLDENGKPTCEYVQDDGTVVTGAYDCVPLLDQFIEQHPDFSYKGAKGTIALTGYNGILGYRTDIAYKTRENLGEDQEAWLNAHPDFNWEQECEEAKKVAEALKADGWKFASHTWGHIRVGDASLERLQTDTENWLNYVAPLIGGTDTIIFAHGQDLAAWNEDYASTEKFQYLKSKGFSIYCNVDSSQYFVQSGDLFFRMGRRNLDGYRLYQSVYNGSERLNDLMDPASVWDQNRPTDAALYSLT